MKRTLWLVAALILLLAACQPQASRLTILDGEQIYTLTSAAQTPAEALVEAGVTLGPDDRLLYLGAPLPPHSPLPAATAHTLAIRRAVTLTVVTPDGAQTIQTSALTVGRALSEAGFSLGVADRVSPPVETPLTGNLTVIYQPARDFLVTVDGSEVRIRSAAGTVGQALAEAGIPLIGLDTSLPSESAPLPEDGKIRIVRVVESVALVQKSIPYGTRIELSADLELDQQTFLQGGEPGLAIARIRSRAEDGVQVSQVSESESIVRPPQDQVLGVGTKVVLRTAVVDGVSIEYWRALQFYATSYHPAETGSDITASGKRLKNGMVAIDNNYIPFGTQMYVPGYGYAEAADTGAFSGRWIDLGYLDQDYRPWHQWVTVYFLWPPPAVIAYIIPPPMTWSGYSP